MVWRFYDRRFCPPAQAGRPGRTRSASAAGRPLQVSAQQRVPGQPQPGQPVLAEGPPLALQQAAGRPAPLDGGHVDPPVLVQHPDLLGEGHLPPFGVPVGGGQQPVGGGVLLGDVAVQLALVVPQGHLAVGQVGVGAAGQLLAHCQERLRRAAVEPARHIRPAAVVGDVGPAAGVAVVAVKDRPLVPESGLLHHQQPFAPVGAGQELRLGDRFQADQVGVCEKQVVHPGKGFFLAAEHPEPEQRAVGPVQRLLGDAPHVAGVFPLDGRGVGEDEKGLLTPGQEFFPEGPVKLRPEHHILPGADIQDAYLCHALPSRIRPPLALCLFLHRI